MGKLLGNFELAKCFYHSTELISVKCCDQVSGVAFDSYWSSPNSSDNGETVMYRFGSVGQVLRKLFLHFIIIFLCHCVALILYSPKFST